VLIYSNKTSERLQYILEFIAEQIGLTYTLTQDAQSFESSTAPKINYSESPFDNCLNIIPISLLFENDIHDQDIQMGSWDELPVFFKQSGEIPFDLFAATFYLLSRYEEYLAFNEDEFKRYPHKESLAFQNNFLNLPLIDLWLIKLKSTLETTFEGLKLKQKKFEYIPTYDIDIAYSYLHKGMARSTGGFISDLLKGDLKSIGNRKKVLSGQQMDPYDSYDFLDDGHSKYNLHPTYFFLVGEQGPLDKNLDPNQKEVASLIRSISSKYDIGIHPSYQSHEKKSLRDEKETLEGICSKKIEKSRQHYIRFKLPETYRELIEIGIKEDFSMGYGSINGFRASTSNSFNWFDLSSNKKSDLRIQPFSFMECNSFFEQKQSVEETRNELKHYIDLTKKTKGTFCSIWHNFSLGSDPIWKGWKELYLESLEWLKA